MKRCLLIFITLLPITILAQCDFIVCPTNGGLAETPMFRKTFTANDGQSLFLIVTSLGYHEVYINGHRVGNHVLQPAVSQLDKRALSVSYNINPYTHSGNNELIIWVGQGWGRIYGTPAALNAQIIQYSCNNRQLLLSTDTSWESSPSGYSYTGSWQPLQFGGEKFDARATPKWQRSEIYHSENIKISQQRFNGNIIVDTIHPVSMAINDKTSLTIDFGKVVTGWLQLDFPSLSKDTEVKIDYLDHLHATSPHTETDVYISDGKSNDYFTNRFHSHSFRYVNIRTSRTDIPLTNIIARALPISAVNPHSGATFECSDQRFNAIHDMVKHTLSCLTHSGYMVDCPHLERMGYGGDGNSSTMTLQTIWDVRSTYANWLTSWSDAIEPDGELPYVAPSFRTGGGPYWSGFIIKAPWRTYLNYAERDLITEHYDEMCLWLEYIRKHSTDGLLQPWPDNERHTWFLGDWLAPNGVDISGESVIHVSNCFIYECLTDIIQIANMLDHLDDAQFFTKWSQQLKTAIHKQFYHQEKHIYANGTPLDQSYALLLNIPPDSNTAILVKSQLINDCYNKYNSHIAVGLMGVPIFTEWCIRERQTDLMATILRQPDYPGYLFMINNQNELPHIDNDTESSILYNQTTLPHTTWESWDGERSHVHNCYNGIGIWFYQALAGILPDNQQPGYKHFFIDPQPCNGIEWVRATKPTLHGDICVEITHDSISVVVPEGTSATIFPNSPRQRDLSSGKWVIPTH